MIYLFDFEDSFTFNIYSEIKLLGYDIKVVPLGEHFECVKSIKSNELLILGPGPGSPIEYNGYKELICSRIRKKEKTWGICLGHQLIGSTLDLSIEHALRPIHGQATKLDLSLSIQKDFSFPFQSIEVQHYNSLAFQNTARNTQILQENEFEYFCQEDQVDIFYNQTTFSCQFHPESVGTSYRKSLFSKVLQYLI
jgi:anthranilate/para-aminobenzoate synthase component II